MIETRRKTLILNCCFHHCQSPGYLYALGATQARAGTSNQATATLQRAHAEALRWQQPQLAEAITRDLSKISRSPF